MKPKLIFYIALALLGGLWIALVTNGRFEGWLLEKSRGETKTPDALRDPPDTNFFKTLKIQKTLKTPWTDFKVSLLRADGQVAQLDAKKAVYTIHITKIPNGKPHQGFDVPVTAFIDPATSNVWIGQVNPGNVDTNEIPAVVHTNFYFEAGAGIFAGDSVMFDGMFDCDESLIKNTYPGEDLNGVIQRFEKIEATPFNHVHWEIRLNNYFQKGFFRKDDWKVDIQIQREKVTRGKLQLDFKSPEFGTTASVWLDLKTLKVVKAVEHK